jgi:hypothetical protein
MTRRTLSRCCPALEFTLLSDTFCNHLKRECRE